MLLIWAQEYHLQELLSALERTGKAAFADLASEHVDNQHKKKARPLAGAKATIRCGMQTCKTSLQTRLLEDHE